MTETDIALIRAGFPRVAARAEAVAALFYQRLFTLDPSLRPRFAAADLAEQGRQLMVALGFVVASLDRMGELLPAARALARRHAGAGLTRAHYATAGEALLQALAGTLGEAFRPEEARAWARAWAALSAAMMAETCPEAA
ncbi:MAG: globin domain-containing protein [Roseococcus sp.]|nr:globin domain-containing protein [Roseococcus sp.]